MQKQHVFVLARDRMFTGCCCVILECTPQDRSFWVRSRKPRSKHHPAFPVHALIMTPVWCKTAREHLSKKQIKPDNTPTVGFSHCYWLVLHLKMEKKQKECSTYHSLVTHTHIGTVLSHICRGLSPDDKIIPGQGNGEKMNLSCMLLVGALWLRKSLWAQGEHASHTSNSTSSWNRTQGLVAVKRQGKALCRGTTPTYASV